MRGVRWFVVVLLVAFCLPLLGCSKDTGTGAPLNPSSKPADSKDKDKKP